MLVQNCSVIPDWGNKSRFFDFSSECYANEKAILNSQMAEIENALGADFAYIKFHYSTERDKIWGEDVLKYVDRIFFFKAVLEEVPQFSKQYLKSGIDVIDVVNFNAQRDHFQNFSKVSITKPGLQEDPIKPQVGDLVMLIKDKSLPLKFQRPNLIYEITYVNDDADSVLQSLISYKVTMKIYKRASDDIAKDLKTTSDFNLESFKEIMEGEDPFDERKLAKEEAEKIKYVRRHGEKREINSKTNPFAF